VNAALSGSASITSILNVDASFDTSVFEAAS
jgi:hypothetical protein